NQKAATSCRRTLAAPGPRRRFCSENRNPEGCRYPGEGVRSLALMDFGYPAVERETGACRTESDSPESPAPRIAGAGRREAHGHWARQTQTVPDKLSIPELPLARPCRQLCLNT